VSDQDHRVALFRPWEKIDADDRWLALETAGRDHLQRQVCLVRHGNGWLPDYRRMRNFAGGEPEADRFILDLHRARAFAALAHVRFGADKSMSKTAGLMLTLATAGAVIIFASPGNAIECDRGTQKVNGQMIFTPYCQDEYLSEVAREYGFTEPAARLRNNPNFKKEICRFVFQDIRVQITCMQAGIPEYRR
jgi:hypothetical protein